MVSASTDRRHSDTPAPRTRSAVTNGRRLHVIPSGDSAWGRRFKDILAQIVSDLSGPETLSEGQRQLARRCATIAIECERLEGLAVAGSPIDLELYGRLTDRLGRAFQRLGLDRKTKDITPSLAEYIAQNYANRSDDEEATPADEVADEEP
jgi:hypothetical protein